MSKLKKEKMKEEEMGRKKKEWDKEAEKRVIKEVEELKKELFRAWHGTFFFLYFISAS